jgi:topoisomerase-4 subunit A
MLLDIAIRKTSQFDLEKNRADMEKIKEDTGNVEKNLANIVAYACRYLRNLIKKYGDLTPRRTTITTFDAIAVRELTATELKIFHDPAKGYLGYKVDGAAMVECSSLDRLLIVWKDGRYKVIAPPDKLFIDTGLAHCSIARKDQAMTVVYTEGGLTYIKKLAGGAILNKEYRAAPEGSEMRLFTDSVPPVLYVRYHEQKGQLIRQQEFTTESLSKRDRESPGVMMTSKDIEYIGATKPADWNNDLTGPKGLFLNMA